MKSIKRSPAVKWIILPLLLLVCVCSDYGAGCLKAQTRSSPDRGILRDTQTAPRNMAIVPSEVSWCSTLDALVKGRGTVMLDTSMLFSDGIMVGDRVMVGAHGIIFNAVNYAQSAIANDGKTSCLR